MKVYLDNGATTMTAAEVVEAMKPYYLEKYGNASSIHEFGQEAKDALDNSRETIAKSINADPKEIIFTSGGTESDNLAIMGVLYANKKKGAHVITSKTEHPAVKNTCESLEKSGFSLTYLDVDNEGFVNLDQLEKSITDRTVLVSIIHANNEIGTIQDIEKIGNICKQKNVLFHIDAVQSFTKVPIDVKKINVDLISISSHKIHGPKGIGALFVKKGTKIQALSYGGPHEFKLRAGTENIPAIVGFAKAVELADEKHIEHMTRLRDKLITELLNIPNTQLNGSKDNRNCNNVNVSFHFVEGEAILMHLDGKGIAVSTASACTSHSLKPSHVLLAIGLKPEIAHGSIRLTLSRYTTEKEIDYTIQNIKVVLEELRKISPFGRK